MVSNALSACVQRFLTWVELNRKPATAAAYRYQLERFARWAGPIDVTAITPASVTSWNRTFHGVQAVQRLCNWLHREERSIAINPLHGMKKVPSGARRRTLDRGELAHLLRGADATFRAVLLFLRETMARPQEVRALTWADVAQVVAGDGRGGGDLRHAAYFTLADAKGFDRRSDRTGERVIPISPRLARLLGRLSLKGVTLSSPILKDSKGRPWTSNGIRCRMRRLRVRLGFTADRRGEKIVAYSLRHTGATAAVNAGVRDFLLAEALGHSSTRTTARYVHLKPADVCDGMKAVWELKRGNPRKIDRRI